MPGFDPALDKEIFSEELTLGQFRFKVSVMSYNDGAPKMQISRERMNKEGEATFAKLGRLTLEEATAILPMIEKVKKFMEENAPAGAASEDPE